MGGAYPGLVLDLGSIDVEEIAGALADQTDYEQHRLISPDTGEIAFWTADTGIDGQTPVDLDELDLVVIDHCHPGSGTRTWPTSPTGLPMNAPGAGWPTRSRARELSAGFKDELHEEYPDLLPACYAFRDTRARRRAVQWLADNSLIDDDSADTFLVRHPDPALPEPYGRDDRRGATMAPWGRGRALRSYSSMAPPMRRRCRRKVYDLTFITGAGFARL